MKVKKGIEVVVIEEAEESQKRELKESFLPVSFPIKRMSGISKKRIESYLKMLLYILQRFTTVNLKKEN